MGLIGTEHRSDGLLKDPVDVLPLFGRALDVTVRSNFVCQILTLRWKLMRQSNDIFLRLDDDEVENVVRISPPYHFFCDWMFSDPLGLPHIHLGTDEDDRHSGAVMVHLRVPLFQHVVERIRIRHRETNYEDVLQSSQLLSYTVR